jgi:hypothetical protein
MDNIMELSPGTILLLAERLSYADMAGKTFRIATGTDNKGNKWLKYKVGEGTWSPKSYGVGSVL